MINHYGKVQILRQDEQNWLRSVAVCPSCGKEALYGSLMMYNGVQTCPWCHEQKRNEIERDRKNDYDLYVAKANSGAYEPFAYHKEKEEL